MFNSLTYTYVRAIHSHMPVAASRHPFSKVIIAKTRIILQTANSAGLFNVLPNK